MQFKTEGDTQIATEGRIAEIAIDLVLRARARQRRGSTDQKTRSSRT